MAITTQTISTAGYNTALGLAREATFGSAVAPTMYIPFDDHNLAVTNKLITNMAVRKSAGMPKPGIGSVETKGSISVSVDVDSCGPLLGAAMGSDVVTGPSAGVYTHTMKLGGPLNTYTLSADDGQNSVSQYVGCKANALDLSCKPDGYLTMKVDVIGQTNVVLGSTSLTPSFSSKDFMEYAHLGSLNGGTGVSTINGVSIPIVDFNISLKNNLKPHYGSTGGRFILGVDETNRDVSGTFSVNYDSAVADSMNLLLWGSSTGPSPGSLSRVPIVLTFTQSASAVFTITLGQITFSDNTITRKKNDILVQSIKFMASESTTGAADDLQIVVKNTTSTSYYT